MRLAASLFVLASAGACGGAPATDGLALPPAAPAEGGTRPGVSPPPAAPVGPAPPGAEAPALTPLFCAYGGVGVVPVPTPPDFDVQFASVVVRAENPGPPLSGVALAGVALLDEAGAPLAVMRRVDHLVVLDSVEPPGPAAGSFAVYLGPEGRPFDGTLPTGATILRARVALDAAPIAFPAHCRLELSGAAAALTAEVALDGVWPTS